MRREREGPSRGSNGEIRCVRDTPRKGERGREGEGASCVCRIADALTVPRACVTSPFVPRTYRPRPHPSFVLPPSLPPSLRSADLSPRIDPLASTGNAVLPPSSHYPPPLPPLSSSSSSRIHPHLCSCSPPYPGGNQPPRGLVRHVEML